MRAEWHLPIFSEESFENSSPRLIDMKLIKIALLCLSALPLLVWAAANDTSEKKDYACVKNGRFCLSPRSATPVVFSGINYPSAVEMVAAHPATFKEVVQPNLDYLSSQGVTFVRLNVPLKIALRHDKRNMAKAENDSVLAALALIVEHVEQLHQYVVLCLNCEPANDSMIGGYDAEDYNAVVCQTAKCKMPKSRKSLFQSSAVFSWEIGRFESMGVSSDDAVADYARVLASLKQTDPNHLVSISCGNRRHSRADLTLMDDLMNLPEVDYINMNLLPLEWKWTNTSSLYQTLPNVYIKAQEYFDDYLRFSRRINKPLIVSEISYPRDRNHFEPKSPVDARNSCFNFVTNKLKQSEDDGNGLSAAFFGIFIDETEKHVPAAIYASDTQTLSEIALQKEKEKSK